MNLVQIFQKVKQDLIFIIYFFQEIWHYRFCVNPGTLPFYPTILSFKTTS